MNTATILQGDVRERLAAIDDGSVQACITSPPYWGLRDYGHGNQIGLEETPEEYVAEMVAVFNEVKRVLADDGVLWLNVGDSYFNNFGGGSDTMTTGNAHAVKQRGRHNVTKHQTLKIKDLAGIPWRLAFALQNQGWYLRQDVIWHKPNPMPESVTDRCTKSHEYLFMLTKSARYFFNNDAIKEPVEQDWGTRDRTEGKYHNEGTGLRPHTGLTQTYDTRNKRSVWSIPTKPFKGAHFAVMPEALVEPCILASTKENDLVLDPFTGSATVAVVATKYGRNFIGTELNPEYVQIAVNRITEACGMLVEVNLR